MVRMTNGKYNARHIFFVSTLCTGCFLFFTAFNNQDLLYIHNLLHSPFNFQDINMLDLDVPQTITTEGCTIPLMKPLDKSVKKFVYYPKNIKQCTAPEDVLLEHNRSHIWIKEEALPKIFNNREKTSVTCCYKAFFRPNNIENIQSSVDNRVQYTNCVYFSNVIEVKHEFVKVNCYVKNETIYEQFFLFALKKKFIVHNDKREILRNISSYNVLVMGIDAVSRLNFYRTMPKTIKYLKDKGAIDLAGYNKVGDNTFPNLMPMLMNYTPTELTKICLPHKRATFDNCPFVWEWFKQAGYYTALAEDSSKLGTFNYLRKGFINSPTDYYLHTFINEAEIKAQKTNYSLCMNNKYFYKVLLDYLEDITTILNSSRLFGLFWEITMSHDYLNYPMIMDNDYVKFFKNLDSSNYLNETFVFLLSDHGLRWGAIRSTRQGRLEERLPFVFILVPQSFKELYSEAFNNLKLNSKRLTTPFNIYATLSDLVDLNNVKNENIAVRSQESYGQQRSISLFLPIPSNRTCAMAGITDHWCTCLKDKTISKQSVEIIEASTNLVKYMNKLIVDYPKCVQLTLAEIIDAREMIAGNPGEHELGWREFLIIVRTKPGDGVFEATLRHSVGSWTLLGTVSRLNLYGDQSRCVHDNLLKLYCYCL